jgi:serine/threonine protein kinase
MCNNNNSSPSLLLPYETLMSATFGKGAFGNVSLGLDKATGTLVALKSVPNKKVFRRECNVLGWLRSKARENNVVHLMYVTQKHIVMPLYGPSLQMICVVKSQLRFTDRQTWNAFVPQMITSLAYCHSQGILHMDVKPSNFVVNYTLPYVNVTLIDFGLAVQNNDKRKREKAVRIGSPLYMSPNMHLSGYPSFSDDAYSLMYTLLMLLCHTLPWSKCSYTKRTKHSVLRSIKTSANVFISKLPASPYVKRIVNVITNHLGILLLDVPVNWGDIKRLLGRGSLVEGSDGDEHLSK